jgi:hypothetical protein
MVQQLLGRVLRGNRGGLLGRQILLHTFQQTLMRLGLHAFRFAVGRGLDWLPG